MKSKKLQKQKADFDAFEKPRKSGAKLKQDKRPKKKLSIYDDLDELDEFVLDENEFRGFDDFYNEDDDDLY